MRMRLIAAFVVALAGVLVSEIRAQSTRLTLPLGANARFSTLLIGRQAYSADSITLWLVMDRDLSRYSERIIGTIEFDDATIDRTSSDVAGFKSGSSQDQVVFSDDNHTLQFSTISNNEENDRITISLRPEPKKEPAITIKLDSKFGLLHRVVRYRITRAGFREEAIVNKADSKKSKSGSKSTAEEKEEKSLSKTSAKKTKASKPDAAGGDDDEKTDGKKSADPQTDASKDDSPRKTTKPDAKRTPRTPADEAKTALSTARLTFLNSGREKEYEKRKALRSTALKSAAKVEKLAPKSALSKEADELTKKIKKAQEEDDQKHELGLD